MEANKEHLQDIKEIRNMMERSTRFLSLSGLSGVFAGVYALAGVAMAYFYFNIGVDANEYYENARTAAINRQYNTYIVFITTGILVLGASLLTGAILTYRRSRKQNASMWDSTSKRLLINLLIPLITGGLFCFSLLIHGKISMVAPATLIFYGLALINASKYTFDDIRYLGMCEIALGLIASIYVGYGLLFWAIGFGVLHIIYGISMYYKYERE
jgi:hypothetical protein